ncbi:MAG: class I SAM-dependent methyltransferase [Alphaproteobacteria bacterium]|nr:class I SAM-dependent methyltransferase [Alphaproteobacteria bacterium]
MPDDGLVSIARPRPSYEVLETVSAAGLAASWRADLGIDVGTAFAGVDLFQLCRDPATGLVFFDPPVTGPPDFYARLRRFDWYRPPHKEEHATAARWIPAGARVLDIGAGDGRFAAHVPHARYRGIETDPEAVAAARARGLDVREATLSQVAGEGGGFDVVAAFQVLEHLADPFAFASAAVDCLPDAGLVMFGVPDGESYVADLPDFVLNAPPHHVTWWTETALRQLARDLGLTLLAMERFPVEPWERRLWWMARVARALAPRRRRRFGRRLRTLKIASWLAAGLLARLPVGFGDSSGATLLLVAGKRRRR